MQTDFGTSLKDESRIKTTARERDFSSTNRVFPAKYGGHKEVEIPP
jgi:hypothetical protein